MPSRMVCEEVPFLSNGMFSPSHCRLHTTVEPQVSEASSSTDAVTEAPLAPTTSAAPVAATAPATAPAAPTESTAASAAPPSEPGAHPPAPATNSNVPIEAGTISAAPAAPVGVLSCVGFWRSIDAGESPAVISWSVVCSPRRYQRPRHRPLPLPLWLLRKSP